MRNSKNRITKRQAQANADKADKAAAQALKDIQLVESAGLSSASPVYMAARAEFERAADAEIAAREILNAIGTGWEAAELKYQELWKRLTVLNELVGLVADAGFSPVSTVAKAVAREADRVGKALNAADEERAAIKTKL